MEIQPILEMIANNGILKLIANVLIILTLIGFSIFRARKLYVDSLVKITKHINTGK